MWLFELLGVGHNKVSFVGFRLGGLEILGLQIV